MGLNKYVYLSVYVCIGSFGFFFSFLKSLRVGLPGFRFRPDKWLSVFFGAAASSINIHELSLNGRGDGAVCTARQTLAYQSALSIHLGARLKTHPF